MLCLRWLIVLLFAWIAGKLIAKLKMPSILGWLIVGMILGPHAVHLMTQEVINSTWYKLIITWMQCTFGLMLGTELIWKKIKNYGKSLIVTTLTQSLGTFVFVSLIFGIIFYFANIPIYLALAFGGIALATAPAPALSIVQEFHTCGPVTNTLLPMAVLDDIVGIVVFFTVNSLIARAVSGGTIPLYMIPVMIFLPVLIGAVIGFVVGKMLQRIQEKKRTLAVILCGITLTTAIGLILNKTVFTNITLNYMLMGVAFSAVFSNMLPEEKCNTIMNGMHPIVAISLLAAIVDLGAPLDYHLIMGAGLYTFVYIISRMCGKYGGARIGAKLCKMPLTVQKYLGLTLLPHSGVSLVFTGIISSVLAASQPELAAIVTGTVAAAAIINEIIAVIASKKGFELAGEISKQ